MCGIFGYVGPQDAVATSLAGLKCLEYRGYDSAGIAGLRGGDIAICKATGKISALEEVVTQETLQVDCAIAHTRWATHGAPTHFNAHPHTDEARTIAVVHNGIIENYALLRQALIERGTTFSSETDTEVIAQLIASVYQGDILKAVQEAMTKLQGSFAVAVIHKDFPDQIIAAASESPLAVGVGDGEAFVASDIHAFLTHTREVFYLTDSEVAVVKPDSVSVFDVTLAQVAKKTETIAHDVEDASKGSYEHFTLKEIFEQPQTIRNALLSRYLEEDGTAIIEGLNLDVEELRGIKHIVILACGTSWHAGGIASYLFEDMARIPTQVEISSEYRYKNPIVLEGTLVIAISQSGETADTIAAARELRAKGAKIVSICNVQGSTLAREAHGCIFLRAGAEIGVCSTKAFTSQLTVLALFALMLARMHHMSKEEGSAFLEALKKLPYQVQEVLAKNDDIAALAKKYSGYDHFFYLGRRYMYPSSLEGALKLKEISYINASGYPAGEMKHGPIALINERCPTIALCANKKTFDKMISNLKEIKARGGPVLAIIGKGNTIASDVADDVITIPETIDELAAIPTAVVTQLLAYYIAHERGTEIDQPRNLAKSVTVE